MANTAMTDWERAQRGVTAEVALNQPSYQMPFPAIKGCPPGWSSPDQILEFVEEGLRIMKEKRVTIRDLSPDQKEDLAREIAGFTGVSKETLRKNPGMRSRMNNARQAIIELRLIATEGPDGYVMRMNNYPHSRGPDAAKARAQISLPSRDTVKFLPVKGDKPYFLFYS